MPWRRGSQEPTTVSTVTDRPLALVTGGSRGIGAAVAAALSDTHELVLLGRDADALRSVADPLPAARTLPVDLGDFDALAAAVAGLSSVDVLVHSAGTAAIASLEQTSADVWRYTMELNVIAVAELTRLLLPALRAAGGHVVLINSGQGRNPSAGWGAYAASKFALRAYADVLRAEETGLRVTTVYPGRTDTDMQRGVRAAEGGEYQPERYLRPASVAAAVRSAVTATPDAHLAEMVIRPNG
jgi:NADP-dependent 3-hydroxy acid dehydrogenase YdfG